MYSTAGASMQELLAAPTQKSIEMTGSDVRKLVTTLPCRIPISSPSLRQDLDQHDAGDEASDVRPECYAAGVLAGGGDGHRRSAQELQHEPETGKDPRRQPPEGKENDQGHEPQDAGFGIQNEVGAHHAGDGAARADAGNVRAQVQGDVRDRSREAADEVKDQVREAADVVFNVVAENPQEPHVADDVQPSAMQKH